MRRTLDGLYLASGVAAALFLAMIAVSIMAQVVGRLAGYAVDMTEVSGLCMAASTFLGLAYTFRDGGHIRITLLIARFKGRMRKGMELWCCLYGAALCGFLSWQAVLFVMESIEFGDVSPGIMAIPFWIPQSGMTVGFIILTIALLDAAWAIAHDRVAGYERNEDSALAE